MFRNFEAEGGLFTFNPGPVVAQFSFENGCIASEEHSLSSLLPFFTLPLGVGGDPTVRVPQWVERRDDAG